MARLHSTYLNATTNWASHMPGMLDWHHCELKVRLAPALPAILMEHALHA